MNSRRSDLVMAVLLALFVIAVTGAALVASIYGGMQ